MLTRVNFQHLGEWLCFSGGIFWPWTDELKKCLADKIKNMSGVQGARPLAAGGLAYFPSRSLYQALESSMSLFRRLTILCGSAR